MTPEQPAPTAQPTGLTATFRGNWEFEKVLYPFEITLDGETAVYRDIGPQGAAWPTAARREGDDVVMIIRDYRFEGYPYETVTLRIRQPRADGSCAEVTWRGKAAFTDDDSYTAACET